MYEQDYIMRMVTEFVRLLAMIFFVRILLNITCRRMASTPS